MRPSIATSASFTGTLLISNSTPRLELGEVQNVVDEAKQEPLVLMDATEVVALCFRHRTAQPHLEQLDVAGDRIQRRAELVAHVGDEFALRPVRVLRLPSPSVRLRARRFRVTPRGALRFVQARVLDEQRGVLDLGGELSVL
jgi:hypothetical protein